jgi:hypothetical protein
VLQVVSSSPGALELVFRAMLENATRICEAKFGSLFRFEGDAVRLARSLGVPEPAVEFFKHMPRRPREDAALMRATTTKQPVQVVDLAAEPVYKERDPIAVVGVELMGVRSLLVVPMLKSHELRRPSRYRHRERAIAERIARIAATTDRDRRRAQSHQPLDL